MFIMSEAGTKSYIAWGDCVSSAASTFLTAQLLKVLSTDVKTVMLHSEVGNQ